VKKSIVALFFLAVVVLPCLIYAGGSSESEQLLKTPVSRPGELKKEEEKRGEFYIDSYFEPSEVVQGSRPGRWREITNRLGYIYRNIQGYVTMSQWRRFDVDNYAANFGSYINFPNSFLHLEAGWGWDITYMYKFQSVVEYGHRIKNGLFWQAGYTYRNYAVNDSYMVYPGLIYYFGNNYVSLDYGMSLIESRGLAHFGTVKGNFALTKRLSWLAGGAVGRRLYDIFELPARDQFGYIIFTGLNVNVYKGVNARIGCSYGTEKPDFIKRSLFADLSVKF
jgi:hypothetical protein